MIELITHATISAYIMFLFNQFGNMLDRKNRELLSKKAGDIKNNKEVTEQEIQIIILELYKQKKKIPEIDSVSLFLSWISRQSRDFSQLLSSSEMILEILLKKREHEQNLQERKMLLKFESGLVDDMNKYKEKLLLGENEENERRLLFERIRSIVERLKKQ